MRDAWRAPWPDASRRPRANAPREVEPSVQTRAAMQSVRVLGSRAVGHEDGAARLELDTSVCDEVAELVVAIRRAQADGTPEQLRRMAHPAALRREHARVARALGFPDVAPFWSQVACDVEAVRIVADGMAEVYERVRHEESGVVVRLMSIVEHVRGKWRLTDARDATDERLTAVLMRGAPPERPIDGAEWTRRWERAHGPTATLEVQDGRGVLTHPVEGWVASVRVGSGRDVARRLGLRGPAAELLDKQPAATVLSLVPVLDARKRTEQLRWLSRAVAALGERDASSVWVPSAAKAVPFSTWASAVDGPLELSALAALWLRTQRQRGAWVTRGLGALMLPEVEVWCAGLSVATVRALLREAAGRLLAHHEARITRGLGAGAPAVPAAAPRLYRRGEDGPVALPFDLLETTLDLGDCFVAGEVEAVIALGRQGPRPGESYGRWGSIALRTEPDGWVGAA